MSLKKYREKRILSETPEPSGSKKAKTSGLPVFCIQKHAARRLHYDFRLEHKGVLLSWAIPKEPTLNPKDKRLAIHVEDHPFEYRKFEGTIPKGNYGAGTVEIWDEGTFTVKGLTSKKEIQKAIDKGLEKGHLEFHLEGKRLTGTFHLVKIKTAKENEWLFIPGKSELPGFIKPMLAEVAKKPFNDPKWLFETKWDGYRTLAYVDKEIQLYSRNQNLFNELFPLIITELKKVQAQAILDGEIVILDSKGKSDFQQMQNYQRTQKGSLYYYVFDLLYLNGEDLREVPLIQRKEKLKALIDKSKLEYVRYSDHILGKGIPFFEKAQEYQLEGILAKEQDSRYVSKRSSSWLKIKTQNREEAVIGGFTEPRSGNKNFGALLLGVYNKKKEFIYIGHVGTGFTNASSKELYQKMKPLVQTKCPFKQVIKPNMPVTWIKPKLVCEVAFAEWTSEEILRQPSFKGLRIDKKASEVYGDFKS